MMIHETIVLNKERDVRLETYVLPCGNEFRFTEKRPAVLILPGGGYNFCSDREAEPIALAFNTKGFHAFVLRYSVGEHKTWPNPLNDYGTAMQLIKQRSTSWNIIEDNIAVIGFSAGGHLASAAATMSPEKPDAVMLGYAVTLNEPAKAMDDSFPGTVDKINRDTPPMFVFASRNDPVVPIENQLAFITKLNDLHLQYEAHVYAYANHGFSLATEEMIGKNNTDFCSRTPAWFDDAVMWLDDVFSGKSDTHRVSAYHDAYDSYLSVDHSLHHVLDNDEARALLSSYLNKETSFPVPGRYPLLKALQFVNMSEEDIGTLNKALNEIKNI